MTPILIIGAGAAGGDSVLRQLLARGCPVRALTRRPESAEAGRLREQGVEVVRGDLDDRASLRAALSGCAGVFAWMAGEDDGARESRRGRNLINAVAGSEVDSLVFSAPSRAHDPYTDLEAYARSLDLPATFLRLRSDDDPAALGALVAPMFDEIGR